MGSIGGEVDPAVLVGAEEGVAGDGVEGFRGRQAAGVARAFFSACSALTRLELKASRRSMTYQLIPYAKRERETARWAPTSVHSYQERFQSIRLAR